MTRVRAGVGFALVACGLTLSHPAQDSPQDETACVTLVVDGMRKSRSGAT
jgi:hypothetical protein